jgi:hypothetical protein
METKKILIQVQATMYVPESMPIPDVIERTSTLAQLALREVGGIHTVIEQCNVMEVPSHLDGKGFT